MTEIPLSICAVCKAQGHDMYSHMEWNGDRFAPQRLSGSSKLAVTVNVMFNEHSQLGTELTDNHYTTHIVEAIADSGCQTCTAGVDLLQKIRYPESCLLPTRHQIIGITNSQLEIIGSLLLQIT